MFTKTIMLLALTLTTVFAGMDNVVMKYFETPVSHFGLAPGQTFNMRYLIDDSYFLDPANVNKSRPILFYCGNEGDILQFYKNSGFMTETLAEKWGGLVVFGEHRYFGGSWPFNNQATALLDENLKYLTVDNTLMDYNELVKMIKMQYADHGAQDKAVMAFGGSYGGMLAAWMRMKYPQTIQGALAASAPIMYFHGAQNMDDDGAGFFDIITEDFEQVNIPAGGLCKDGIQAAFLALDALKNDTAAQATMMTDYKLCDKVTGAQDVQDLYDHVSNGIAYMAMTDYPYAASFLTQMPAWPVNVSCEVGWKDWTKNVTDTKTLVTNLLATANVYFDWANKTDYCVNFKDTGGAGSLAADAWNILQCNQLAMPNSTGDNSMFLKYSYNYTANTESCNTQYKLSPDYTWAIREFGGADIAKNLAGYSNIIFSNGKLDPWRAGGVTEFINLKLPYYIIQDGAHHLDLRKPVLPDDIGTDVERVRKHETLDLEQYIAEYQDQFPSNTKQIPTFIQ